MKTLVRLDALSKIFVLVIFYFSSSMWCPDLAISYSALQCKIINSSNGHYFAWKTDGWKNNEQQNRCQQVPIQRLYSDTWCDNRNVIYLPFYAVIEWFQLKFRHAHLFKKKHKMRLFDLRLDYKAIKVIRDLHLKCIIYCWVLSIVLLGLIMVVSHCFWFQNYVKGMDMILYMRLYSYRACNIMHVHPFFPYWPFDRSCGFTSVLLSL